MAVNSLVFILISVNLFLMTLCIVVPKFNTKFGEHYGITSSQTLSFFVLVMCLTVLVYVMNITNISLVIGVIASILYKLDIILFDLEDDIHDKIAIHRIQIFIGAFVGWGVASGVYAIVQVQA